MMLWNKIRHALLTKEPAKEGEKGTALIITIVIMVILVGMTGSFMLLAGTQTKNVSFDKDNERCYGVLHAAISRSMMELNADPEVSEADPTGQDPGEFDGIVDWTDFAGGRYRVMRQWQEQGRFKLLAQAQLGTVERFALVVAQVQTETQEIPGQPFLHALFQGGETPEGDPNFNWGGTGDNKDEIRGWPPPPNTREKSYPAFTPLDANPEGGNIYVGDDFDISGDAILPDGATARADGTINNTSGGATGITEEENSPLDIPTPPDYTTNPEVIFVSPGDFNAEVNFDGGAFLFGDSNSFSSSSESSYTLKDDPRHIFRMDSGDTNVAGDTDRHDFFFEDMFADTDGFGFRGSSGTDKENTYDDSDGYQTTVAPTGNNKVYFIEGNMWLHNAGPLSYRLMTSPADPVTNPGGGTHITIVAKGNVFISDNFLYQDLEKDAIAFIALKDPNDFPDEFGLPSGNETREGSGNIQFGDLNFGTTFRFAGYMYAENDFNAVNVDNALNIYGNMTAGNRVNITKGSGSSRKALIIDYDARIEKDLINMPGLPNDPNGQGVIDIAFFPGTYHMRGYTEITPDRGNDIIAGGTFETQ